MSPGALLRPASALFCAALVLGAGAAHAESAACGGDAPCMVTAGGEELGEYRLRQPRAAGPSALRPAILFIHGWRESAGSVVGNKPLQRFADEIGAVLIAPQGLGATWSYPGSPSQRRDEFAYFDALRRDVVRRHKVDPKRILVSGFSMGASMAWNLACRRGDQYWGFAPFSGAFWDPLPPRCENPPRALLHVHGEADRTVPIEGRSIRGVWRQSDALKSFALLREALRLSGGEPVLGGPKALRCRRWSGAPGRLLEFCRHDGGHFWRVPWLRAAWRKLQDL